MVTAHQSVPGTPQVFEEPHWLGMNTGGFLLRNCQWSLDLLDAAMALGNKYTTRRDTGILLNKVLKGRAEASGDHGTNSVRFDPNQVM